MIYDEPFSSSCLKEIGSYFLLYYTIYLMKKKYLTWSNNETGAGPKYDLVVSIHTSV